MIGRREKWVGRSGVIVCVLMFGLGAIRDASAVPRLMIYRDKPINERWQGIGFQVRSHLDSRTEREMNEIFVKRWRELDPVFAWVAHKDGWDWDEVVPYLKRVVTRSSTCVAHVGALDPKKTPAIGFARRFADDLERLVRKEGIENIRFCSIAGRRSGMPAAGGSPDPSFLSSCYESLAGELRKRKLDIGIVGHAGDIDPSKGKQAAPAQVKNAPAISVSCNLMSAPDKLDSYASMTSSVPAIVKAAGGGQAYLTGVGSGHFETEQEAMTGLQLAELAIAAINSGAAGVIYTSLTDLWHKDTKEPRAPYYALGILARHLCGPGTAYLVATPPSIRMAAVNHGSKGWTLVVVNRRKENVSIQFGYTLGSWPGGDIRKYVYRATRTPKRVCADLQLCEDTVIPNRTKHSGIPQHLEPLSLNVFRYTHDTEPPERIRHLDITDSEETGKRIDWEPVVDKDLCYYRVYRMNMPRFKFAKKTQIGSTTATHYVDDSPPAGRWYYHVVPVDQHGNVHFR